ncbi:MAG: group 1 truncated hemoglobin [Burkholderiaceae bacterium]
MEASTQRNLYERLGRKAGIERIVEDVMAAHLTSPIVRTRFENSKDIDHAKRMAAEFFCAGCGGPEPYTGRDMLTTHRGMNISEQEYMAVMDDILGALGKNGIDQATQNEVVAVLYSLKNQIIRV